MTRADLYTLLTSLLGGLRIDTDLFNSLLDVVQMNLEGMRPWVWLRAQDTSKTFTPSDSYTTAKALPADFKEWYGESPISLVDSNNNPLGLTEIPFAQVRQYKNSLGVFAVDYPNSNVYIMGAPTQTYTIYMNYIKLPTLVSSAASATWIFPTRFHKILALMCAVDWKLGVDYDIINNSQGNEQAQQTLAILDIMTRWDSRLQQGMQRGLDPFGLTNFNNLPNGNNTGGYIN